MKTVFKLVCFLAFILSFELHAQNAKKSLQWSIKHVEWSRFHQESFQEFIARLGEAREKGLCRTTNDCLKNPEANPLYYHKNPNSLRTLFADCADLPHVLLAYFSWMNDLPFSYQRGVSKARWRVDEIKTELALFLQTPRPNFFQFSQRQQYDAQLKEIESRLQVEEERIAKEDIRYTTDGNSVRERRTIRNGDNINDILNDIVATISTATYRIHADKYDSGSLFKDMYHVKIDRASIVPGTVLYDPAGHIAVVYKVTDDGRILLIDAHPDNSLTRVSFGEKFSRSSDNRGAGFVRFRPTRLVGARFDERTGTYTGGRIEAVENRQIADFSMEQFYGTESQTPVVLRNSRFVFEGKNYSYHEYVRRKLARGALTINPVRELEIGLQDLCLDLKDRNDSVNAAISANIHLMDPPATLPENIYGTHGTWETYSTPSRDARFKSSARQLHDQVKNAVELHRRGSNEITYHGDSLVEDLYDVYLTQTHSCEIEFKGTSGRNQRLNLDEVLEQLFKLSFDPYHCIELRWGLTDNASLNECGSTDLKWRWYTAQQRLRQTLERDYSLRMNYSVSELPSAPIGEARAPQIHLRRYLEALQ